ncbi:MAG: DUF2294 domain-containing protein [Leptolyngbya sp. SIO4C1]|nr:DUF2294 domain-containing protein [Leptolyngbya sp. SIO4C1]
MKFADSSADTGRSHASKPLPTAGELERLLSQSIQSFYREAFGQKPKRIICHLFSRELAVVAEGTPTKLEQFLKLNEFGPFAQQLRLDLDQLTKPRLISLIEEILAVPVIELLVSTGLESGYTGMLAVLAETPPVRNPDLIPKTPAYQQLRRSYKASSDG